MLEFLEAISSGIVSVNWFNRLILMILAFDILVVYLLYRASTRGDR